MNLVNSFILCAAAFSVCVWGEKCVSSFKSNTKLFCYYSQIKENDKFCKCSHVVLPEFSDAKLVESVRKLNGNVKILVTVKELNEKNVELLKGSNIDGIELNLKKIDSKDDLPDFVNTVKSKLGSKLYVAVSIPSKTESLVKFYDFKALIKDADVFILNTAFLGSSHNVTFHPSRLSGLWDMQNTDSFVDLVNGLGAPLSKLVITAPVQAYHFTLQNEEYTAPGSPALELRSITRKELCEKMGTKNGTNSEWTLERDQDQAGPYIFRGKNWIAFEDETSIDIKTKYTRVRGLAGLALKDLSQDDETQCGTSILTAAFKGLSKQARAPRAVVLHTLEREILSGLPQKTLPVQSSPFRISRVIDTEGKIHAIRQDTRTEFECSRQGYFVHPRSCNRFYRCVKFDQRTDDYNVFEFDCPAGLAFDEKTEVCVWPGSLKGASACSGSSEIAPVPRKRFTCPTEPGYYADPENCRWFFACLDHGEPEMQAYEFRCPFGLVFDEEKLLCEWPWLVTKCGFATRGTVEVNYYGGGVVNSIDQYEGLGVLQTVKLGGIHGTIPIAPAKTYSNVGLIQTSDKFLSTNVGYNSAHFIDASQRLGLSLKATQSLYNAGFLDINQKGIASLNGISASEINQGIGLGNQYQNQFQNQFLSESGGDSSQNYNFGSINNQGANAELNSNSGSSQDFSSLSESEENDDGKPSKIVTSYDNSIGLGAFATNQNLNVNQNSNDDQDSSGESSPNVELLQNSQNLDFLTHVTPSSVAYTTANSFESIVSATPLKNIHNFRQEETEAELGIGIKYAEKDDDTDGRKYVSSTAPSIADQDRIRFATGYVSSTTIAPPSGFVSYQNSDRDISSLSVGEKGIIPGGYQYEQKPQQVLISSTYKTLIDEPKEFLNQPFSSKVAQSFANVQKETIGFDFGKPQDEQKIKLINVQSQDYVSSTQAPQSYTTGAYSAEDYKKLSDQVISNLNSRKPQVFTKQPRVEVKQTYAPSTPAPLVLPSVSQSSSYVKSENLNQGYFYDKPSVEFNEGPKVEIQQSYISSTPSSVVIPSAAQSYSYTKHEKINQGYAYEKPSVIFRENPKILVQQPRVEVKQSYTPSTPSSVVISSVPQSYSHTKIENTHQGYVYERPQVVFKEEPKVYVQQPRVEIQKTFVSSTPAPSVSQSFSYVKNENSNQGYAYEKPTITFEEKPRIIVEQPRVEVKQTYIPSPAVSQSFSYTRREKTNHGYVYEKPQVVFKEEPKIYVQQPRVEVQKTYVSSTPSPQVIPSVSQSFSYVKNENANQGYVYDKPAIFEERPKILFEQPQVEVKQTYIPSTPSPSFSQSYSYTKNDNTNQGYVHEKPQVVFKEEPKVFVQQPRGEIQKTYVSSTQAPSVSNSFSYVKNENINQGYVYEKPQVIFKEEPKKVYVHQPRVEIQKTFVSSTPAPSVSQSFSYVKNENSNQGYIYDKPVITFEEKPKILVEQPRIEIKQTYIPSTPSPSISYTKNENTNQGYVYEKPQVIFKEEPKVYVQEPRIVQKTYVSSTPAPSVSHSFSYVKNENQGYVYNKPAVVYEEKPKILIEQPRVEVKQTIISSTPSSSFSYVNNENTNQGYVYEKPQVVFKEEPKIVVKQPEVVVQKTYLPSTPSSTFSYTKKDEGYIYQKPEPTPTVYIQEQPKVYAQSYIPKQTYKSQVIYQQPTPAPTFISQKPSQSFTFYQKEPSAVFQPVVQQPRGFSKVNFQQAAVKSYASYTPTVKGYDYPKPQLQLVEEPKAIVRPVETPRQQLIYYDSRLEATTKGYDYPKPKIQSFEAPKQQIIYTTPRPTYQTIVKSVATQKLGPIRKPTVYYYENDQTTPAPQIRYLQSTTVKPVTSSTPSFTYYDSRLENTESEKGYVYPKPQIKFEYENKAPVEEVPIVPKKAYVTGQSYSYNQKLENVKVSSGTPVVLEDYVAKDYYTTPKPIVKEVQPEIKQDFVYVKNRPTVIKTETEDKGYDYPKPQTQFVEEPQVNVEQKNVIVESYVSPSYQKYDQEIPSSTVSSRVQKVERVKVAKIAPTPPPVRVQKLEQEIPVEPFYYYDSRLSTETPEVKIATTTSPIFLEEKQVLRQEVTSFDSRYSTTPQPTEETPSSTYLPVRRKMKTTTPKLGIIYAEINEETPSTTYIPLRKRVKVATPPREYLPSTPSREYLPRRKPAKEYLPSSTTPSREYLPSSTTEYLPPSDSNSKIVENYENFELVRKKSRPVKVVKIVRPRVKTVVVKNDFNPLLTAKLGAQCTCTSNTVDIKKEPLRIEIPDYEEDEEDNDETDGAIIVEEFNKLEKNDDENDETEEVVIKPNNGKTEKTERTEDVEVKTRPKVSSRGRTRAKNIVIESRKKVVEIEAPEVRISTPRVRVKASRIKVESSNEKDENEDGDDEKVEVVSSKRREQVGFERYGPGGVRDKSETLQGIDCQRAGLFRHPTQCNKFYSCRWDCKKNKFTLHVFNCPVHLTFDNSLGACNWPSQGPACLENTLLPNE